MAEKKGPAKSSKSSTPTPPAAKEESKGDCEQNSQRRRNTPRLLSKLEFLDKSARAKGGGKRRRAGRGKRLWERHEDEAVEKLVQKYGVKKWSLIAEMLDVVYRIRGRNGKQCRERWHNHLDPQVRKLPLSDEEEKTIFAKHREFGNRWAEIAKFLNGRTDNVIKNYFYATLRRQFRKILKKIKGRPHPPPEEITLQYINKIMKENSISYDELDNKNVKAELELMNCDQKAAAADKVPVPKDSASHRYMLRGGRQDKSDVAENPSHESQKVPPNPFFNSEVISSSFTLISPRVGDSSPFVLQDRMRSGSQVFPVHPRAAESQDTPLHRQSEAFPVGDNVSPR
eukprot:TRINITY_DN9746_c0_g1_i8.p1 TRINITY_DN9746_c0_g1~~TRINITY_DN9746_c0_g1_i8.p1  ORF type:complete len:342 (+),score=86.48 TRINITY_DN9746_c0_g1_i8:100-1125(+)